MSSLVAPDLQSAPPTIQLRLDRVGVVGVPRTVRLADGRAQTLTVAAHVDVPASLGGAHMSRFHEALGAAIDEATAAGAGDGDTALDALAGRIAQVLLTRQECSAAHVAIEAAESLRDAAPITGAPTHEPVTWLAQAAASGSGVRTAGGVRATGFNACPCAQGLVQEAAAAELAAAGYDDVQIREVLAIVPAASHNQRAEATLVVGSESGARVDPLALLQIARDAMSARTYETLKRPDELHVVQTAHRRPMFVEDSARAMLLAAGTVLDLADADVIVVSQRNLESIHTHDVTAARTVLVGTLRAELAGTVPVGPASDLETWLTGA